MQNLILKIGRNQFYPYICIAIIIASYIYTDPVTSFSWRYTISFIAAIAGMACVIFLAKRKNTGNYFGLLSSIGESIANFLGGNIGAGLPYFSYGFATHLYGIVTWDKNSDSDNNVITKKLNSRHILFLAIGFILAFAFSISVTKFTGTENTFYQLMLNSTILGLFILAQTLMILRFELNWYLWIAMNICVIILNINTINPVIATQYAIYLFNAVYGLIEWKNQKQE